MKPFYTCYLEPVVDKEVPVESERDFESIYKWLECNNRLNSVAELGIASILLEAGQEIGSFLRDTSRVNIESESELGKRILDFLLVLTQRRLGEECCLVRNETPVADMPLIVIDGETFTFSKIP